MHRLFAKQLERATSPAGEVDLRLLGELVSSAYEEADRDRRRTDRSIRLMIEELDRVNARLLDAFDVIPEGLVLFDAEDRYVLWNRRYAEMYPESAAFLAVGARFEDTLRAGLAVRQYPEAVGREEEWLAQRLARHAQPLDSHEQRLPGGRWLRIEERRTKDGGSIGIRIDITDIKRREASFRLLFDANPVSMVVVDHETRQILAANDAALAQYGYTREQFLSRTLFDLIADEDRDEVIRLAKEKKLVVNGATRRRHTTADGRVLDVAIYSRALDYDGRGAALAAVIDMTEHERARAAERRLSEVLSATITSMNDAVLVFDGDGQVVIANPAAVQIFGDRKDIGSREWAAEYLRYLPDGSTPFPEDHLPMARVRRGEVVDNVEILVRAPGAESPVHLVASGRPLKDADGRPRGAVLVYRDITRTQEAERQLRQAQKMEAVGQLTGGIAHDFNNLLTVITGTIEILAEAVREQPRLSPLVTMIDDAATRAAELTQHLLAFARKQPLQPCKTFVNELIGHTVKLLRPALGERIEIETQLEDEAWPALIDPNQLTTALLNLAVNARDAMPEGGRLTFETVNVSVDPAEASRHGDLKAGSYVMISVRDTGAGIPAAIRERVFEPFFTTNGGGKGTGRGLSMVYGFIKQSGGHIQIESAEQRGTVVRMYLPRAEEEVYWSLDPQAPPPARRGSETILVVEDDPLVREYVTAQLQGLGYQTQAAANAADALALIDNGLEFDLLFTDVVMPGSMNGWQLAEQAMRRRSSLKVVFTSGYSDGTVVPEGWNPENVEMLAKPYRKVELARIVRAALDQRDRDNGAVPLAPEMSDGEAERGSVRRETV